MKYYYSLDTLNRINHITEEEISYYEQIELSDAQFKSIILFETGIINGKLTYIGKSQEEKDHELKESKESRISELKALLAESDWKAIVNYELFQAGSPIKYIGIHEQRQAWRDEINELEQDES